jgi:hemoglobin-like flavoprotein
MDIRESVDRVLASEALLGEIFYEEFFREAPEATSLFEGVDMRRQALVLTMALPLIAHHQTSASPAITHYLQLLGSRHRDRSVPAELYTRWSEAMLVALERLLGVAWDEDLAVQWRAALRKASTTMLTGYEGPVGI